MAGQKSIFPVLNEAMPDMVRHCVRSVINKGKPTEDAFAICISNFQKHGYLEPGSLELTDKGKAKNKEHSGEKGDKDKGELSAKEKKSEYEKQLAAARKERQAEARVPTFGESLSLLRSFLAKAHSDRPSRSNLYEQLRRVISSLGDIEKQMEVMSSERRTHVSGLLLPLISDLERCCAAQIGIELSEDESVVLTEKDDLQELLGTLALVKGGLGLASGIAAKMAGAHAAGYVAGAAAAAPSLVGKIAALGGAGILGATAAMAHEDDKEREKKKREREKQRAREQEHPYPGANREETVMIPNRVRNDALGSLSEGVLATIKTFFHKIFGKGDVQVGVDMSGLSAQEQADIEAASKAIGELSPEARKALTMELSSKIRGAMLSTFHELAREAAGKVVAGYPQVLAKGLRRIAAPTPTSPTKTSDQTGIQIPPTPSASPTEAVISKVFETLKALQEESAAEAEAPLQEGRHRVPDRTVRIWNVTLANGRQVQQRFVKLNGKWHRVNAKHSH